MINDLWDRRSGRKWLGESEMWVTALVHTEVKTRRRRGQEIAAEVQKPHGESCEVSCGGGTDRTTAGWRQLDIHESCHTTTELLAWS